MKHEGLAMARHMARILAHEINNRNMVVSGYNQFLKSMSPGTDQTASIERVSRGLDSASNQLTDLAQKLSLMAGREAVHSQDCAPVEVLLTAAARVFAGEREAFLTIEIDSETRSMNAHVDREKLDLIFEHVLCNALNYRFSESMVALSARTIDGDNRSSIRITLQNSIDPDTVPELHDMITPWFTTVENDGARRGTGLNIVAGCCHAMDLKWNLDIDSSGKLLTWSMEIPAAL